MIFKELSQNCRKNFKPGNQSFSIKDLSLSQNTHRIGCYSISTLTNHTIFHVNIRSLNQHFNKLQYHFVKNFKYTIICLIESWLEDESNATHFRIVNYTFVNRCHFSKHQSTGIYVHDSIKAEVFDTEFKTILMLKCTTLLKKLVFCGLCL